MDRVALERDSTYDTAGGVQLAGRAGRGDGNFAVPFVDNDLSVAARGPAGRLAE